MAYIDDLQKYRAAIKDEDVDRAWKLAHHLVRSYADTPLGLGDSRDLVVLRWLERIRPDHSQLEMQIAQLAVDGLQGSEVESRRCEKVLVALFG